MENSNKTQLRLGQAASVFRRIRKVTRNSNMDNKVSTYNRIMARDHDAKTQFSGTVQNISDVKRSSSSSEGGRHLESFLDIRERTGDISENMSKSLLDENEMLKYKVLKIEMENLAQQQQLKKLEKMVMELTCNRSSAHTDIQQQPPFNESVCRNSPLEITKDLNEMEETLLQKGNEDMEYDCRNEVGELSQDVASLMEEFDRNARENGLLYNMTPCHSFADSEDLAEVRGLQKETVSPDSPFKSNVHSEDVSAYPLPAFLTPSYHGVGFHSNPHFNSHEPMVSPQLCFTTPVLLTAEALREAEKCQDLDQHNLGSKNKVQEKLLPYFSGCSDSSHLDLSSSVSVLDNLRKKTTYSFSLGNKSSPFSNLLAGLNQASHSHQKQNKSPIKGIWPVIGDKSGNRHHESTLKDLRASHLPGFSSPSSSVGSVCGQVCKWSRTLKHPLLSPLSESRCSDLETHASDEDFLTDLMFNVAERGDAEASDEEDLVVDEVVSLSVAGGSRHRSESFSSITGPCVPPDLLLDTKKSSGKVEISEGLVKEEDVLTEIAGELETSVMLEDSKNVTKPFWKEADHLEDIEVKAELPFMEEVECHIKNEQEAGLDSSRSVVELIGSKTQVIDEKILQDNTTSCVDRKDVKLPAGSIILAMVNESGSLVPLPQLQVASQSLSQSVKLNVDEKILDEEVDVETVLEKTPVLEAGDLDSLLAQFEASEAVNKTDSGSPKHERSKSTGQSKILGSVSSVASSRQPSVPGTMPSSNLPQISPTHQNIKDALPKEIIEKIKASTKRKSTQMLSEPVVVRKGRGVRQQEANTHRTKTLRVVSQTASEQNSIDHRVPPPLDHDYCFSPEKQKKNKNSEIYTTTSDGMFSKLPDYYTTIPRQEAKKTSISDDSHDDGGKKDSGVESGDVSDASIETEERRRDGKESRVTQKDWSARDKKESETDHKNENVEVYNKLPAYMTDIGNSILKDDADIEGSGDVDKEEEVNIVEKPQVKKIKRKLNLSEYRQRIQSAQSSRCPSLAPTSPSSTPLQLSESIEKLESTNSESIDKMESTNSETVVNKQVEGSEDGLINPVSLEEDIEEGELKGDSDPETIEIVESENLASGTGDSQKEIGVKTPEKLVPSVTATLFGSSDFVSCNGLWKSSSRTSMRRWSSSSRSRSRSRSPHLHKKQHTSRKHRSSRGKRKRTCRRSYSSQSPHSSSRRRWSRSHSRSKSRGRSSSNSLSCSSSRSRSRSRSIKTRERWGYSHRFSSQERRRRSHSHSRSPSSSRYSRVTRSRSPVWGTARRSRSPSCRFSVRPRRPEDEDRTRQVEERRVIYIGRISEGTTKGDLRRRFQKFGEIVDISVHFREHGDNYGFVTFKNRDEAYFAVEHGNDDPSLPRYDLCFGGRRAFCRVQYSDLDAQADSQFTGGSIGGPARVSSATMDFDSLLRAAMKKKTR